MGGFTGGKTVLHVFQYTTRNNWILCVKLQGFTLSVTFIFINDKNTSLRKYLLLFSKIFQSNVRSEGVRIGKIESKIMIFFLFSYSFCCSLLPFPPSHWSQLSLFLIPPAFIFPPFFHSSLFLSSLKFFPPQYHSLLNFPSLRACMILSSAFSLPSACLTAFLGSI